MLRIGLIGVGLTGSAIARYLLDQQPEMQLVMAAAGPSSAKAGTDLGILLGLPACGVDVIAAEKIPAALQQARPDAIIDFSRPDATIALLPRYARLGCGVVVGTTGFSEPQLHQLKHAAGTQRFGLMYAPNITRGVNVLMLISKLAAGYLPGYDIEITERHHRRKKDAPSGTAAKIAAQLHETRGGGSTVCGRQGTAPRTEAEIGVHAVRAGGIIGVHEVLFAGDHDEIVITHRSESRQAFAAGAVEAAAWIAKRRGFYTVEDMIMDVDVATMLVDETLPVQIARELPVRQYAG